MPDNIGRMRIAVNEASPPAHALAVGLKGS
jgi:hypothetical protein